MEQQEQPSDFLSSMEVDYDAGNHFKDMVKWTNFIAIIFIVCLGLLLLMMVIGGLAIFAASGDETSSMSSAFGGAASGGLQIALLIPLLVALIYGGIQLYRFTTYCRRGLYNQDQAAFNLGLKALRNYFIFYGIVAILSLLSELLKFAL